MCTTLSCTKYRKQPQVLLDTSKQWTPVVQKLFEAKEVLILKLAAPPPHSASAESNALNL